LPGPPYTANTRDQPPPWYRPEGSQQQSGPQGGAANDYISRFGGHSRIEGHDVPGISNINPEFASRIAAAGRAYQQATGRNPAFGETYRDVASQAQYYDRFKHGGGLAARPGASRHQYGLAVDIPSGDFRNWLRAGNARQFGLEFLRDPRDPGHLQMGGRVRPIGQAATPAARPAASSLPPRVATPQTRDTQHTVATTMQKAGMTKNAISGIMANIADEPDKFWDPSDREYDKQGAGEAGYAHGLYQEGGDNWNKYQQWLRGRDWRDPALQTQFMMENLSPGTRARLNAATSAGQAAQIFLNEYLKPALKYRIMRGQRYGRGVPMYEGTD
jgi:hypothetical protein